jgi:PAS domain-containing protein
LEALQHDVKDLQSENQRLRLFIQQHIPGQALQIINDCCGPNHELQIGTNNEVDESDVTPLAKTDMVLVQTLTRSQQNFILTDPTLPDNPIVFASHGFLELTGYTREEVSSREDGYLLFFLYEAHNRFPSSHATSKSNISLLRSKHIFRY